MGGGRQKETPTFGHRYRDISLIIPQSAFRCSVVVSSASARRDFLGSMLDGVLFAPFCPRAVLPDSLLNAAGVDANPRARIRCAGQRRGAPRATERRTRAESIWAGFWGELELRTMGGGELTAHGVGGGRGIAGESSEGFLVLKHNDARREPHGDFAPAGEAGIGEYATEIPQSLRRAGCGVFRVRLPQRCRYRRGRARIVTFPARRPPKPPSEALRAPPLRPLRPLRLTALSPPLRSPSALPAHPPGSTMAARRPNRLLARPLLAVPYRPRRTAHIKATPSISAIGGPVDLSEQTQAIPKLSGAGPFPAGTWMGCPRLSARC